jgi:dTDP-glucose 4,6-dehydratase/UDP-glucose 4-epimerase
MKILIIGSMGFIGQHLFRYFSDKGNKVWGTDVIPDYINKDRYFLIDASNSDYTIVFQSAEYDLCVNCSGAANVPESLKNPLRDYYLNSVNVFKILNTIRRFQPACKFINLSSAAVYGNPKHMPVKEDSIPDPLSPYGFHKLQAEQICKEFYDMNKIKTCSLRIFSVYGPGLKKQLFWDLHSKANNGVPFTLFGTGNESRDFIYILDLMKAIELVAEHSAFNADVINIADGKEILIKNVVSVFLGLFNHEIRYSFSGETREGDPVNWVADISKLLSYGYQPSFTIENGLEKYFEWVTQIRFD